jgi:hypothetical protein
VHEEEEEEERRRKKRRSRRRIRRRNEINALCNVMHLYPLAFLYM